MWMSCFCIPRTADRWPSMLEVVVLDDAVLARAVGGGLDDTALGGDGRGAYTAWWGPGDDRRARSVLTVSTAEELSGDGGASWAVDWDLDPIPGASGEADFLCERLLLVLGEELHWYWDRGLL